MSILSKRLPALGLASDSANRLPASVVALIFGVFLFIGAGFAPMSAAHNAAHDARHVNVFPCH